MLSTNTHGRVQTAVGVKLPDSCTPQTLSLISKAVPVVWRGESVWTAGLSLVLKDKRCSGAHTASP